MSAPTEVPANAEFDVTWTGPDAPSDFVTIVPDGATAWTLTNDYFNTTAGSPSKLLAPTTDGAYEIWYVNGADATVKARQPITVLPFVGSLTAPDEAEAGSDIQVSWFGPNGPGDYIAIVPAGAAEWSNKDDFWNTNAGDPAELTTDVVAGEYEIWYVAGQDARVMLRRPITVTPFDVTLDAPNRVNAGATFEVDWTGPDGPSDYITIVPAGALDTDYGDYEYTRDGSPATLSAPTTPGAYEIRYVSDRVDIVFASIDITVR